MMELSDFVKTFIVLALVIGSTVALSPILPAGNLALKQPAYSYDVAYGGIPSRAVDNDDSNDGSFGGDSCMKTGAHPNSWFAVDLGKTKQVKSVKVINRSDKDHELLTNFDIVVSDINPPGAADGTSNGALKQLSDLRKSKNICFTQTTVIPKKGVHTLPCEENVEGRYVYLILQGNTVLNMCEFGVYGGDPTTSAPSTSKPSTPNKGNGLSGSLSTLMITLTILTKLAY